MTAALIVHRAGPGMTVQDLGRPGYLGFGLSRGGAADRLAIREGAALLGQSDTLAALELVGTGGEFEATQSMRIALTGAAMRASLDGALLAWNASHRLPAGARLRIGPAKAGVYGYLHAGGGFDTPVILGARSAHLAGRIGNLITDGDSLPLGSDTGSRTAMTVTPDPRCDGGTIRLSESLQTTFFSRDDITRFEATTFRRDTRGNRMGVPLLSDGPGFQSDAGLNILSEIIVPGDIQITGDGTPYVLLAECQTTGGYPRIGTVLPTDLPRMAQAGPGAALRFKFVPLAEAVAIEEREAARRLALRRDIRPLIRDPRDIPDLLRYQLISGATAGDDLERHDT